MKKYSCQVLANVWQILEETKLNKLILEIMQRKDVTQSEEYDISQMIHSLLIDKRLADLYNAINESEKTMEDLTVDEAVESLLDFFFSYSESILNPQMLIAISAKRAVNTMSETQQ